MILRALLAVLLAFAENVFVLWFANVTRWDALNRFLRSESELLARLLHEQSYFYRGFIPMFCLNWIVLFAVTLLALSRLRRRQQQAL